VVGLLIRSGLRYWGDTETRPGTSLHSVQSFVVAVRDAATLKYLRGGGPGCDYPGERPSYARLAFHTLVFYGFLTAFASTVTAAAYQDLLGVLPPYPLWSIPVILGVAGGIAMIVGCAGLLALKVRANPARSVAGMRAMDVAFIISLLLVNVSGFAVLALRETWIMGITLAAHLGFTAALFVALPYGKFAHSVYRSLALLRNRAETAAEARDEQARGQP
jgi:citrate/tricarballylate utilization protein